MCLSGKLSGQLPLPCEERSIRKGGKCSLHLGMESKVTSNLEESSCIIFKFANPRVKKAG